jgi:signal transduction histidine kinase
VSFNKAWFVFLKHSTVILISTFCTCLAVSLNAQLSKMTFDYYNMVNGLPSNHVISFAKDSFGFYWYGTSLGLSRSNGTDFYNYTNGVSDHRNLPGEAIHQLEVDDYNQIWGLTGDGYIFVIQPYLPFSNQVQSVAFENELIRPRAERIFSAKGPYMYLFSDSLQFYRIEKERLIAEKLEVHCEEELTDIPEILNVKQIGEYFYFGTRHGLYIYNSSTKKLRAIPVDVNAKRPGNRFPGINALLQLNDSTLIIGTDRINLSFYGLHQLNLNDFSTSAFCLPELHGIDLNKDQIYIAQWLDSSSIIMLPFGRTPIIYNLKLEEIDSIPVDIYGLKKLNTSALNYFFKDINGRLIICSNQGVFIHEPLSNAFNEYFPLQSRLRFPNTISHIARHESSKHLIIIDQYQIFVYDTAQKETIFSKKYPEASLGFRPQSIPLSDDEFLIINNKEYVYNICSNTIYPLKRSINFPDTFENGYSNQIYCFVIKSGGFSWTYYERDKHLFEVNHQTRTVRHIVDLKTFYASKGEYIVGINYFKNKQFVIALSTGQLLIFENPGKPELIRTLHLPLEQYKSIMSSNIDQYSRLWLGMKEGGLLRFDVLLDFLFAGRVFFKPTGLITSSISNIAEDQFNNIWVTTRYGVSKLDVRNEQFLNFSKQHGVNFPHVMKRGKNKDSSGQIYFNCMIGFVQFNPADFLQKEPAPLAYISEFSINNHKLCAIWKDTTIQLNWKQSNFSFLLGAVTHTHAFMTKYKYKMAGLSDKWIEISNDQLNISFNNLATGKYVLSAMASNFQGRWTSPPLKITIIVTPPFWEQWWFIIIVTLILFGTLAYSIYIRLERRRKLELLIIKNEIETQTRERRRIAQDLHDDIGAQLSAIKLYINLIANKQRSGQDVNILSAETSDLISKSIKDMRRIISELSPQTLSTYGYIAAMNEFIYHFSTVSNIELMADLTKYPETLDKDQENAFFRITQELFNNTLKHANAKTIKFHFESDESSFTLYYEDDGKGFDFNNVKNGNGLINIQSRLKYLNGNWNVSTGINKGFKAIINIPHNNTFSAKKQNK